MRVLTRLVLSLVATLVALGVGPDAAQASSMPDVSGVPACTADAPSVLSLGTGVGAYSQSFQVDDEGNLVVGPAGVTSYPSGTVRPHAPSSAGGAALAWNNDGTLFTKTVGGQTTTFVWDAFDRLTGTTGAMSSTMAYWPGGQRALLVDASGTHVFLGGISERHVPSVGVATDRRNYTIGSTLVAVRNATATSSSVTSLFGDVRGSVSTSHDGTATVDNWYQPYGADRGPPGQAATSRGWIGQHHDTSGLRYLNSRYYDPTIGIFLSIDPLLDTTGQPYLYANGNPTSSSDPGGEAPICARMGYDDTTPTYSTSYYRQDSTGSWFGSCAVSSEQAARDARWRVGVMAQFKRPGWGWAGHLLLDMAGAIPVVGEVADGTNAVWYMFEGNRTDAAISAASMIPGFGDMSKLGKYADVLGDTTKYADDLATLTAHAATGRAKTGPKPAGVGPHNRTVALVADSVGDGRVIRGGQTGIPEAVVPTPGGLKSARRPDILVERFDGTLYGVNVGRQSTRTGAPITREAQAINDLEQFGGLEMHFVPYNVR